MDVIDSDQQREPQNERPPPGSPSPQVGPDPPHDDRRRHDEHPQRQIAAREPPELNEEPDHPALSTPRRRVPQTPRCLRPVSTAVSEDPDSGDRGGTSGGTGTRS